MSDFQPAARLQGIEKSLIRQVFDRALPDSINLGLGEPDLPTPLVVRQEAARVVLEEQNGYTMHAGLNALRELVAADYPYLESKPERVVITAGHGPDEPVDPRLMAPHEIVERLPAAGRSFRHEGPFWIQSGPR